MIIQKRWSFGIGTIFSLIVVYFIYLYSKEKEWTLLALISKWYLLIAVSLMLLSLAVILFVILISLLMFLIAMIKFKKFHKKHKKTEYLDAEYEVKG